MKRSLVGILAATAILGSLGQTAERASHAVRAWTKRTRRNSTGTKLYRELQQRKFNQGATK